MAKNDFECAKHLIKQTGDKPRYIPEKSEFLRYADWAYYQNTTPLTDFKNFLLHDCGVSDDRIDRLMFDFQVSFMHEESTYDYFEILANNGIMLEEYQVREFTEHTMNCFNNTRLWANKAYTPYELLRFYGNSVHRKTKKIGRNDPCPCGSNKKYKKCCGR